jgi:hypothetical protein
LECGSQAAAFAIVEQAQPQKREQGSPHSIGDRFFCEKVTANHCAVFRAVVSILALHLSAFYAVQLSA